MPSRASWPSASGRWGPPGARRQGTGCGAAMSSALTLCPPRLRLQVSVFYRTSPKHKLKIIKVSRVPLLVPRGTTREGGSSAHGWPSGGPRAAAPALGRELGGARAASTKGREWERGGAKGGTQRPALARCCCLAYPCIGVLTPGLSFLICKLGRM